MIYSYMIDKQMMNKWFLQHHNRPAQADTNNVKRNSA